MIAIIITATSDEPNPFVSIFGCVNICFSLVILKGVKDTC